MEGSSNHSTNELYGLNLEDLLGLMGSLKIAMPPISFIQMQGNKRTILSRTEINELKRLLGLTEGPANFDIPKVAVKGRNAFSAAIMRTTICNKVSPEILEEDVRRMINIFLQKGANIDAIIEKTNARSKKKRMEYLKNTYELKPNVGKGKHVITLARVAACFPQITITVLHKISDKKLNRPVDLSVMRRYCPNYPKVLMTTVVCCVIPKQLKPNTKQKLYNAICLYSILEQKRINKKYKDLTYKDFYKDCLEYIMEFHETNVMNEEERLTFCKSEIMNDVFGVDENGELVIKEVIFTADAKFNRLTKEKPAPKKYTNRRKQKHIIH